MSSRLHPGFRVPNAAAEKLLADVRRLTDQIDQMRKIKKHTYSSGQAMAKAIKARYEKQEEMRAMFRVAD
jgi:hypothetical protein